MDSLKRVTVHGEESEHVLEHDEWIEREDVRGNDVDPGGVDAPDVAYSTSILGSLVEGHVVTVREVEGLEDLKDAVKSSGYSQLPHEH